METDKERARAFGKWLMGRRDPPPLTETDNPFTEEEMRRLEGIADSLLPSSGSLLLRYNGGMRYPSQPDVAPEGKTYIHIIWDHQNGRRELIGPVSNENSHTILSSCLRGGNPWRYWVQPEVAEGFK